MIQFLGNIEAKADAKGRVFIPATFRKQLQAASEERLVLRKDVYQDCLVLYPESVWFATQNQLATSESDHDSLVGRYLLGQLGNHAFAKDEACRIVKDKIIHN